jgi:uracil phosphoribosyltransferase
MKLLYFLPLLLTLFKLNAANPILEDFLYKLRDPETKRYEFRESLENIGKYLGYEIANDLETNEKKIKTVLGEEASHSLLDEDIVVVTILRAGIPIFNGFMDVFKDAESGFFAMSRNEETLKATTHYEAIPNLDGKTVILVDTMIATAGSVLDSLKAFEKYGNPKKIIVAGAMVTEHAKEKIEREYPNVKIYVAVLDPILNDIGYIVPGCGDAGDRSYGEKMEVVDEAELEEAVNDEESEKVKE